MRRWIELVTAWNAWFEGQQSAAPTIRGEAALGRAPVERID